MKKIILVLVAILLSIKVNIEPKDKSSKGSSSWSTYQGRLGWYEAWDKCWSIGMRLPTIDELKLARRSKVTKSWDVDGYSYWSSTPDQLGLYYLLYVPDGSVEKANPITAALHVRCKSL
jgi:hypothetical protein